MEEMRTQKQDMEENQCLIHGEVGVRKNSQVLALEDHPQLEIGVLARITNMETNKLPICFQGVVAQADAIPGIRAGGGALAIHADGDIIIADGVFISANGGDALADGIYDHGGGVSGGAIRLVAKNIYIKRV